MRIVVLDGHTLNPGDLSWRELEQLGELTVYDRTPTDLIAERSAGAEVLLTNKVLLSAETITGLPQLRYIGVLATGYNVVDVAAARRRDIPVTNIPDYSTASVAQHAFALLLELCHRVQLHSDAVFAGEWTTSPDFCFTRTPLIELAGKMIGIIGFGRIGQQTAQIAAALGMKIMTIDRGKRIDGLPFAVEYVDQRTLLTEADVISLHCPLTPETEGLINTESIAYMKREAILINTSRGGLVVERDLAAALNEGRIAGAGLDVLSSEPPQADNPLLSAKNCVITPHIAWATKEARSRCMDIAVKNVAAFLSGEPINVVN